MALRRDSMTRRRGLTLIELILSLAVMAILAAIVLPPMAMLLSDRRLSRAADLVQIQFSQIRLDSMRSGHVLKVDALIDGDRLFVDRVFGGTDATESSQMGPSALASGASQAAIVPTSFETGARREIELPPGIAVAAVDVLGTNREMQTEADSIAAANNPGFEKVANSQAVYFYPDGSTSDATVDLREDDGTMLRVLLRGLTGHSRVIEISP